MTFKYLLFIPLLFVAISSKAQSKKDTAQNIAMIDFHYSFMIPGGDLDDRFGNASTVGGSFNYKFRSNWIFGLDYSFLFGENIKNEDSYFKSIKGEDGYVFDGDGQFAEVFLYERGFNAAFNFERQFKILNPNENSGFFIRLSPGYFSHKVRIENPYKVAPQVNNEYAKGYDRLTAGFSLTEMLGYRFIDKKNIWNFYGGFEIMQAWTTSQRSFNFDDMQQNTQERLDLQFGFRVGWIIPIRGRAPKEFYYF